MARKRHSDEDCLRILRQVDVELVALEFMQVVAPDLVGFGGLANGDALGFACFLQSFTDRLHRGMK